MSKVITNKKQMGILVRLMEANPDIAKGVCGKSQAKMRWEKFALELNAAGPPMRTWEKWLKVWTDLKFKVKKKMSQNKIEINSTGGGPNKLHTFSDLEESVIRLLDISTIVDPPGAEFGLGAKLDFLMQENIEDRVGNEDDQSVDVIFANLIETQEENTPESTKKSPQKSIKEKKKGTKKQERLVLLEKSTNSQELFHNEVRKMMQDIKESVKTTAEYAKKTYYLQKDTKKELIALKKEKLSSYKDAVKKKAQDRTMKLKLKQEILELQKESLSKYAYTN